MLSGPVIDLRKMPIFTENIIFLDEAQFDLGGYVNKENFRFWGTENPLAYIGFWSRGIIGPHFFENEQGVAVTVNGDR